MPGRGRARPGGPWQDVRTNDGSVVTEDEREDDPQERLRALQRRAFAADGDAAGDPAVARAMAELRARLTDARPAHTTRAAGAPDPEPDPVEADVSGAAAESTTGEPDPAAPDPANPPTAPPDTPIPAGAVGGRPRRRRVLGLAGAVVLGAAVGACGGAIVRPGLPAPAPTADATGAADEPLRAATVFTTLQTAKDIPLVAMPEAFIADSFRYLGSAGWTDADADGVIDSPYYAVRTTSDLICLVVVPEGSGYLSTCAPEAGYPASGLRLSWQSTDLHPGVPGGTAGMVLDVTVAWLSDSTVETRGSGRPLAAP